MTPAAKADWEIGVEMGGCTGSPSCAAGVHIRTNPAGVWAEVHLNPVETKLLIRWLEESLAAYEGERAAAAEVAGAASAQAATQQIDAAMARLNQIGEDLALAVTGMEQARRMAAGS